MDNQANELRFAVLIDADNVPYSNIKEMLEEVAKEGIPTIKRIYADWTKPTVSGWKDMLLEYAITPIQQYSYTTGKNSSDSALIIDAMDILYSNKVEGYCIVSSDSDFTRLATRLREAGMKVIGMGEKKTPKSLITACDKFIYIENITPIDQPDKKAEHKIVTHDTSGNKIDEKTKKLLIDSVIDLADDTGWTFLGDLGNFVLKKKSDFDPRDYGFQKLFPLIKSLNAFEIEERETGRSNVKNIYVRVKQ